MEHYSLSRVLDSYSLMAFHLLLLSANSEQPHQLPKHLVAQRYRFKATMSPRVWRLLSRSIHLPFPLELRPLVSQIPLLTIARKFQSAINLEHLFKFLFYLFTDTLHQISSKLLPLLFWIVCCQLQFALAMMDPLISPFLGPSSAHLLSLLSVSATLSTAFKAQMVPLVHLTTHL